LTLEQYLKECQSVQQIDLAIRVYERDGKIAFYAHPARGSGRTIDFTVVDNQLQLIHVTGQPPARPPFRCIECGIGSDASGFAGAPCPFCREGVLRDNAA
jgi:hypothetical protein